MRKHETCVCRSRLAQVKLMLSLDLDPHKPHEWFFFGWVEWWHVEATKPWEVHPKQTRFIGECRWELDGLEKVQDLRDLTFSRWRWGICKDEDDISMNIIQRMSTMACHWQKKHHSKSACHCSKNPRRQQEHLDGVMLMVAWYVGVLRAFRGRLSELCSCLT